SKIEIARVVLNAVSREIEEQCVVDIAIGAELLDALLDNVRISVPDHRQVEHTDIRIAQNFRQGQGIETWRFELPHALVAIIRRRDNESEPAFSHWREIGRAHA